MTRKEAYQFVHEIYYLLKNSEYSALYKFYYGKTESIMTDSYRVDKVFMSFKFFNYLLDEGGVEVCFILYKNVKCSEERAEIEFRFSIDAPLTPTNNTEIINLKIEGGHIEFAMLQNKISLTTNYSGYLKSFKHLVYNLLEVNHYEPESYKIL